VRLPAAISLREIYGDLAIDMAARALHELTLI
jgi:hypothetical protein